MEEQVWIIDNKKKELIRREDHQLVLLDPMMIPKIKISLILLKILMINLISK
jgi:hypothetical protein